MARDSSRARRTGLAIASASAALGLALLATPALSAAAMPSVTKIAPERGPAAGGTVVTISGSGFGGATEVHFGTRKASLTVNTGNTVTALSPPWGSGNAIAEVTVTTPSGTTALNANDSFIYEPVVTKIEPSIGSALGGTSVTLTGEALRGAYENGAHEFAPYVQAVDFGSMAATKVIENSATRLTASSPAGTGTVAVTAKTLGGTSAATAADQFTFSPQPEFLLNTRFLSGTHVPTYSADELRLETKLGLLKCRNIVMGQIWNQSGRGTGQLESLASSCAPLPNCEAPYALCFKEAKEFTVYLSAEMPLEEHPREAVLCKEQQKKKLSECPQGSEREPLQVPGAVNRRTASFPWALQLARATREEEAAIVASVGGSLNCYPKEKVVVEGKEVERPAKWEQVPQGCVKLDVIIPAVAIELVYYGKLEPRLLNGYGSGLNPSRMLFNAEAGRLQLSGEPAQLANEGVVSGQLSLIGAESVGLITAK